MTDRTSIAPSLSDAARIELSRLSVALVPLCGSGRVRQDRSTDERDRRSRLKPRFALAVALIALIVADEAAGQTYSAGGAGNSSCGTWTVDRRTPYGGGAAQDSQWVLGFLSGVDFWGRQMGLTP
jgi:hypothetical protein